MITKKIKSQKGATFIIALVYFLICMMVGAVMITAASVDRGRSAYTVAEQRDYYAVQSAATLFRDAIAGVSFYDEFEYYGKAVKGDGTVDEFKSSGYMIKDGKKDNSYKNPYYANYRFDSSNPNRESIANPKLGGVSDDSPFMGLYDELAKFFRYTFIKKIGMVDEAAGLVPVTTPDFSGTITLEGGTPVNFKLTVDEEDFTIRADFYTGGDAPASGADPADPDSADAGAGSNAAAKKSYSISLTVKPLDSSIKRSDDQNKDPENTVERRTVEYFIRDIGAERKEYDKQKSFVVDKACVDLRFSNAALTRGTSMPRND